MLPGAVRCCRTSLLLAQACSPLRCRDRVAAAVTACCGDVQPRRRWFAPSHAVAASHFLTQHAGDALCRYHCHGCGDRCHPDVHHRYCPRRCPRRAACACWPWMAPQPCVGAMAGRRQGWRRVGHRRSTERVAGRGWQHASPAAMAAVAVCQAWSARATASGVPWATCQWQGVARCCSHPSHATRAPTPRQLVFVERGERRAYTVCESRWSATAVPAPTCGVPYGYSCRCSTAQRLCFPPLCRSDVAACCCLLAEMPDGDANQSIATRLQAAAAAESLMATATYTLHVLCTRYCAHCVGVGVGERTCCARVVCGFGRLRAGNKNAATTVHALLWHARSAEVPSTQHAALGGPAKPVRHVTLGLARLLSELMLEACVYSDNSLWLCLGLQSAPSPGAPTAPTVPGASCGKSCTQLPPQRTTHPGLHDQGCRTNFIESRRAAQLEHP